MTFPVLLSGLAATGLLASAVLWGRWTWGWERRQTLRRLAPPPVPTAVPPGPIVLGALGPYRGAWLAWVCGAAVALGLASLAAVRWRYSLTLGLIAALLGQELQIALRHRAEERLENQLADALDLMIAALGAGAGLVPAIQSAAARVSAPLKPLLEDLLSRIRLGDDPRRVFRDLAERVPLESFTLLATSLVVHWEAGGPVRSSLALIARTLRDRLEIARRIRSNIVQSQLSTVFVLLVTYFIAAVVWRNNPPQMAAFLDTEVGSFFVISSLLLQAMGILWMRWVSQIRF